MKMTRRRAVTYRVIGEFFRECGALVAVFGVLDHVVHEGQVTKLQILGAWGVGLILLVCGLMFERSMEPKDQ
jgi:hypothetical protein